MLRRGFIASPTPRGSAGADILATNHDCSAAYSVQVKTNSKNASFWLVGEKNLSITAKTHVYVLVNIKPSTDRDTYDYYVVPSRAITRLAKTYERENSIVCSVQKKSLANIAQRAPG